MFVGAVGLAFGGTATRAVDPDTIWGEVFESSGAAAIEWRPVQDGDQRDVWVLFRPDETWYLDDLITLSAGAQTVDGDEVASTTYEFQVESGDDWLDRLLNPAETLWQPQYNQDFNADNLDLTLESNDEATVAPADGTVSATPLNQGIDAPLTIGPEQVYEVPQRVWLPVPEGIDPNAVRVYYYHANGGDKGWYPAGNVEGWMVPDSMLHLRTNGTTYIGFLVRHAGIVQLGIPEDGPDD